MPDAVRIGLGEDIVAERIADRRGAASAGQFLQNLGNLAAPKIAL